MYYRDNRLIYYTPEDLFPAGKIDHSRHYSCSVSGAGETSKTYRIITHWSEIRDTLTYTGSESENIAASAVGLVLGENGCRILTGEEINSIDRSSASNPETVFEVNFDKVDFPASIAFSPVKVWANVAIKTNNNGSAIMNFKGEGKAQGWNNTQWMHQAIERATVEVTRKIVEEITKQVKLTK
jgi:formylmethanofuran dehydrogenase subunit D